MISRRGFLAAIAAGLTLDPEGALWVPGKKLISIPKPPPKAGGLAFHHRYSFAFVDPHLIFVAPEGVYELRRMGSTIISERDGSQVRITEFFEVVKPEPRRERREGRLAVALGVRTP